METAPKFARKLKGFAPYEAGFTQHSCPHGKFGNGWFCNKPGCSGAGLCKHKKHFRTCAECNPAQCPLCDNGKTYACGNMWSHIYRTKLHAELPENEKRAAYDSVVYY